MMYLKLLFFAHVYLLNASFASSSKILITNGIVDGRVDMTDNTEIIDLSNNCAASLPNYPKKLSGATGQFLDDNVIICGGTNYIGNAQWQWTNDCFALKKGATSFEQFHSMDEARSSARSIVTQGDIWVTGGGNENGYLSSTEHIPESSTSDIELPVIVSEHALISINETTSMLIGGYVQQFIAPEDSPKTFYINHESNTWKEGPSLKYKRSRHTAGVIIDHVTNAQHIVVAGGGQDPAVADSIEILYNGETEWKRGAVKI